MALPIGTRAPDFTLKTKTAEGLAEVSLTDNLGQQTTVLLFFPLAFTSVCTEEMCSVSHTMRDYNALGAAVYGISVDSPFSLEVFAKQNGIEFPLLSDFNKEVSKAYDVLYPELLGMKGVAKRSAFVINKEGVIVYSESSDNPKQMPDFTRLKDAIRG